MSMAVRAGGGISKAQKCRWQLELGGGFQSIWRVCVYVYLRDIFPSGPLVLSAPSQGVWAAEQHSAWPFLGDFPLHVRFIRLHCPVRDLSPPVASAAARLMKKDSVA